MASVEFGSYVRLVHEPGDAAETVAYNSLVLPAAAIDAPPLLLLHGSNGNEGDLISVAGEIAPGAARLALRGDVPMHPGLAFFHRLPDRRIDVEDLRYRVTRLARFLRRDAECDGTNSKLIALGYSNGAIMAAALLLMAPDTLAGAILLRPEVPFEPSPRRLLPGKRVLLIDGLDDSRRAPQDGADVATTLRRAGGDVQHLTSRSRHAIGPDDVLLARTWLDQYASTTPDPEAR